MSVMNGQEHKLNQKLKPVDVRSEKSHVAIVAY